MRAVVTGGAGFIGSHLIEALVARGDEVVCIERPGATPGWIASQPVTTAAEITAGTERYDRLASDGPMQIASSASWTASVSRSASL